MPDLFKGAVVWADLDPTQGREQADRRPVLLVSSDGYNDVIPHVVIVLPITTRDRSLPHHILLTGSIGLDQPSYAMTEQPRTIDRSRIIRVAGQADSGTVAAVNGWLRDFFDMA